LIADRGYDSNGARRFLKRRGIHPIIPARANNRQATDQDGRCLRRYRRRWIVERTIGWIGNFRRLTVRYDRLLETYGGFFHVACAMITLRKVLK
jgi:transposase